MRVTLFAFAVAISILSHCDALPANPLLHTPLLKTVRNLTFTLWEPKEDWHKCEQGDTYVDDCGSCICDSNNLFDCTWEHCIALKKNWPDIILPYEVKDQEERDAIIRGKIKAVEPLFYTILKHFMSTNDTKATTNDTTDLDEQ